MQTPDATGPVVILGAGIIGICTALSLRERGMQVTVIDRGDPGQETSMGNAGVVSPWSIIPQSLPGLWKSIPSLLFGYGRPLSINPAVAARMIPWGIRFLRNGREMHVHKAAQTMSHLCAPSIDLYRKHLHGTGHEELIVDSLYVHAFRDGSRANLSNLDYRIRQDLGAPVELVGKDQLAQIEPALSPNFNAAVLIGGQARVRSPGRLGQVLTEKARAMGVSFKRASIRAIKRSNTGWSIKCDGFEMDAERIVMCLGAWSPEMLRDLPLNVPLVAERGYHVEFANPGIEIFNSVMDTDAKVVASSMEGGVRVAGQAEFAPVDAPPSKTRSRRLICVAQSAFPDLRTDAVKVWMGRRPSFPDSLPMLGPVEGQPGLFMNFGHSHYGLMMAPASGEALARQMSGEVPNTDLSGCAPERFARGRHPVWPRRAAR